MNRSNFHLNADKRPSYPKEHTIKCYIEDTNLKFYTKGGFRYFAVFKQAIQNVFPLENGLIIKLLDDPNFERFDPNNLQLDMGAKYVSIIDHPLDTPTPIGVYTSNGPSLL